MGYIGSFPFKCCIDKDDEVAASSDLLLYKIYLNPSACN